MNIEWKEAVTLHDLLLRKIKVNEIIVLFFSFLLCLLDMPFVADLYEKLKSSGLLPEKDGGAPPPPPPPTRRIPMLPLIRLNIKELKL